jgi:hypothetical protein
MARIPDAPEAATPKVPSGWAVASRGLAEAGDDVLVWPELSNAADAQLRWTKMPRRNSRRLAR